MRLLNGVVMMALAGVCQPVFAQTAADRSAFEKLLRERHLNEASAALDSIIDAHLPSDGTPRANPDLNGLVGQIMLMSGKAEAALAFLQASHRPGATADDEAQILLREGQAYLIGGDLTAAIAALDRGRALSTTPAVRASLARARIEALLATDPVKAIEALGQAVQDRAADSEHEWEWSLFDAQAQMLTGKPAAARNAADRAWVAASRAPLAAAAPARAGALLGVILGQGGNRDNAISLIASAAHDVANDGDIVNKIVDFLPVCGTDVTPVDAAIVALFRDDDANTTRVTPLWATRPQVVRAFLSGLDGRHIVENDHLGNAAVVVTLRCRTAPSSLAAVRPMAVDPGSAWAARRGLLPRFGAMGDPGQQLTDASTSVDRITERYGAESTLLIGPLLHLADLTMARLTHQGDVATGRVTDLNNRILALLRKAGGAEGFIPSESNPLAMFGKVAAATSQQQMRAIVLQGFRNYLDAVDFDIAFATYKNTTYAANMSPEDRKALLESLAGRALAAGGRSDPRLLPLRLDQIANSRAREDWSAMGVLVRQTGLPADLCNLRQTTPMVTGNAITTDDFPADGITAELAGRSALEFDLDATGKPTNMRVLATMPSFLFDATIAAKGSTITFNPAAMNDKPTACRGRIQMIRWQLPDGDDAPGGFAPGTWKAGA
ncbi:MAG: hypothetical protein V4610_22980 [Pseudomonadota bacterium]|jgi:tetratricopeptide (TPR) repeat protein